ncbi:MAG TPA: phospholipase [Chloroflexota bacterium]
MSEVHVQRVHTENVVLDIGGDIGALVIYTDKDRDNDEIELSPKGSSARFHNQVHERQFNGRTLFAAVYPGIHAGEYDIWADESTVAGSITVAGGQVATVDWRRSNGG